MRKLKLKELALSENLVSLLGKQRAYWGKYPSRYIVKNALNLDLVYYVLKHLHGLGQCCQGRREGGGAGGGGIAPGPEVLGAPGNFLLGSSLFCVLSISAQKNKISVFFGLSTEIWHEKLR